MEMNIEKNEVMECRVVLDKIRKAIAARDRAAVESDESDCQIALVDNGFFHAVAALVENYWQGE